MRLGPGRVIDLDSYTELYFNLRCRPNISPTLHIQLPTATRNCQLYTYGCTLSRVQSSASRVHCTRSLAPSRQRLRRHTHTARARHTRGRVYRIHRTNSHTDGLSRLLSASSHRGCTSRRYRTSRSLSGEVVTLLPPKYTREAAAPAGAAAVGQTAG